MIIRLHTLILVLITGFVLSCSGGGNPVLNETGIDPAGSGRQVTGDNTLVIGAWQVFIDIEEMTVDAIPLRTADIHANVTPWLTPPKCYDCFMAKNLSYDAINHVVTIDIGFKNPTNLTGYDIRGIITDFSYMELMNPDGWTTLFSPLPLTRNPFVAYKTDVGQREFLPLTSQFETLEIRNPSFPAFPPFTYVVSASWPDNCKDPYEVLPAGTSGDLFEDGSNEQIIQVYARDWQDDVESVTVDLEPIGGTITSLTESLFLDDLWEGPISCAPGTELGDYRLWVQATTSAPFDQTADMFHKATVTVANVPSPETEIFNPPQIVATTEGESFIWPRHAIAVTDAGFGHVVWVDNSPDPDSNRFHVYYSHAVGDTWSPPEQIDSEDGDAIYATVALDSDDNVHIVWEDRRDHVLGSDIYYATSEDNFATEEVLVTGDAGLRNVHPRLDIGDDDTLHIVWHTLEIVDINIYEYDVWFMSGKFVWDTPDLVAGATGIFEAFPAVAGLPDGSAYVTWHSNADAQNGIYFSKNTTGDFEAPVMVTLNNAYQPAIDVAPNGNILIGYFDYSDGTYTDIYIRESFDTGDTWGAPELVSEGNSSYQYAPDVEASGEGDFHVAWHEEDDDGLPGRVFYREKLVIGGWQTQTTINTGLGAFPSMDSDANGHIHMVYQLWTLYEPPMENNYEIWYRNSVD